MNCLGINIKLFRNAKNLTQKQLAELVGVTASTINKYENGNLNPSIEMIKKLSENLSASFLELINYEYLDYPNNINEGFSRDSIDKSFIKHYENILNPLQHSTYTMLNNLSLLTKSIKDDSKNPIDDLKHLSIELDRLRFLILLDIHNLENNKE